MTDKEKKILADIFADPEMISPEEIDNELENLGFNYEEFRAVVLNKISDLKREAIYNEGRKVINKYYTLLSTLKEKLQNNESDIDLETQIRLAFNKLEQLTDDDIKEIINDQKKMLLLKEIVNKKEADK